MELLETADRAVADFPGSVKLWLKRGDLIQVVDPDEEFGDRWPLDEPLKCYLVALELAPLDGKVNESLGYPYERVRRRRSERRPTSKWSLKNGAAGSALSGLPGWRVQLENAEEALDLSTPERCPHSEEEHLREIAEEIKGGWWSP